MRVQLPAFALTIAFLAMGCVVRADDKAEIKALVPAATQINKDDLKKVAMSATQPFAKDFNDQCLTLLLLIYPRPFDSPEEISKELKAEFELLNENLRKPAQLAEVIAGGGFSASIGGRGFFLPPIGPAALLGSNRITDITCDVTDDKATGTVSFKVPESYQGKLNYVARKKDGVWQITELSMPAHRIHVVRGEKGVWKEKK